MKLTATIVFTMAVLLNLAAHAVGRGVETGHEADGREAVHATEGTRGTERTDMNEKVSETVEKIIGHDAARTAEYSRLSAQLSKMTPEAAAKMTTLLEEARTKEDLDHVLGLSLHASGAAEAAINGKTASEFLNDMANQTGRTIDERLEIAFSHFKDKLANKKMTLEEFKAALLACLKKMGKA